MCYRVIPPSGINILNPIIPSKTRWDARFCWTMMNYEFTSSPTKVEVKGRAIHGQKNGQIDI